ncbi:Scr1 family TA system antitoxin-like transcriptional regulator [Streptomyces galilaeus]
MEAVTLENLRGTSVLEGPKDLVAYANAYDLLRSSALTSDASTTLIREVWRSLKED